MDWHCCLFSFEFCQLVAAFTTVFCELNPKFFKFAYELP